MARDLPPGSRDRYRPGTRRDVRHGGFSLYPAWRTMKTAGMCAGPGCTSETGDDPWTVSISPGEPGGYVVALCSEACCQNWVADLYEQFRQQQKKRRRRWFS